MAMHSPVPTAPNSRVTGGGRPSSLHRHSFVFERKHDFNPSAIAGENVSPQGQLNLNLTHIQLRYLRETLDLDFKADAVANQGLKNYWNRMNAPQLYIEHEFQVP